MGNRQIPPRQPRVIERDLYVTFLFMELPSKFVTIHGTHWSPIAGRKVGTGLYKNISSCSKG